MIYIYCKLFRYICYELNEDYFRLFIIINGIEIKDKVVRNGENIGFIGFYRIFVDIYFN